MGQTDDCRAYGRRWRHHGRLHTRRASRHLPSCKNNTRGCLRSWDQEYLDGSGYPDGISGGELTDAARIITLCDIFSALVERRPYQMPRDPEEALDIMRSNSMKIFSASSKGSRA